MSKIGILLADGFEEIEGLTVVDILRRAGVDAVMISITGIPAVAGSHGITVQADRLFEETCFSELDGLVLPGGMPGTLNLEEHSGIREMLPAFQREGKLIAAICAAPRVLGGLGLLMGKKATCYPGHEGRLAGAELCTARVVRDENIITSRSMGTSFPFALELVSYLLGQDRAQEIKTSILYGHE